MSRNIDAAALNRALQQEYDEAGALLAAQPVLTQRFVEAQARTLADALVQHLAQVRFTLPDRVVESTGSAPLIVPADQREQVVGGAGLRDWFSRPADLRKLLRQRLSELEQSTHRAVAISAKLLLYATVIQLVHGMLPAGRSVTYEAAEGEEIPSIPVGGALEPESAITATTDAIAEEDANDGEGRGELLVPYAAAARRFYLPQWVAFDDQDRLLVNSVSDAEAHIASMQRYMEILHLARAFAPYIVADEQYHQKRYGLLGQLVNQGRALARYQTHQIVATIKQRAARHDLNRGLSLSLPYFDDQTLTVNLNNFEVIPAGRIMFVPAFVVRAAREEEAKVSEDTRLNASTRQHLLDELSLLEAAFEQD